MLRIIGWLAEFIFPKRDDFKLIENLATTDFEKFYRPHAQDKFIALSSFQERIIRATIHEAKFHHNEHAWSLLAHSLSRYLSTVPPATQTITNTIHSNGHQREILVIPIPLSKQRQKERGYNQVTEVAKLAVKNLERFELRQDVLLRTKHTPPQTGLSREERLTNVADAFGVRDHTRKLIRNRHIIVLDDVATTGTTMKAAKAALLPLHPASIKCVAFAH